MIGKVGRYSVYLRPIAYVLDLIIIGVFSLQFELNTWQNFQFVLVHYLVWVISSFKTDFYEVYRFTRSLKILSLSIYHFILFGLVVFFYFGAVAPNKVSHHAIFTYLWQVFLMVSFVKFGIYFFLKNYRSRYGGNYRTTIIIGDSFRSNQLKEFFLGNPEYGYKLAKVFSSNQLVENPDSVFDFVILNGVDEIYCSTDQLSNEHINAIIDFTDNNLKVLKFLPDNKDIFSKRLQVDYYGYLPVLSIRNISLEEPINIFIKRGFDLLISTLVIVFILSWLTPILAILIKSESKGPVFFKQKRNGLDYKEFYCFKFRSMVPNSEADIHQVRKNDQRITRVGRFLRKTSIDELPQFYNVFLGDMSVVGPRPHMVSHTHMYAERIDKFMVRHFIKPGITGLAQVSGFRGEVETDLDIINRVKYDIFYLENWSLLLDVKIIFLTVYNTIKGDKKAY
jgi:putative colanic acid biosynthesis UDP-glucose lipid carrier transferase